jgi:hypothetical protein
VVQAVSGAKSDCEAIMNSVLPIPYRMDNGRLTLGMAFAQKGKADIFPPRSKGTKGL